MTNTEPEQPRRPEQSEPRAAENAVPPELPAEPQVVETRVEVGLQRSVRYSRLLIVGAVLGAAVLALVSLFFPVTEESEYTLGQIVGFMALIGAVFGLALGALIGLMLGAAAKRQRGTGVAIQADVR